LESKRLNAPKDSKIFYSWNTQTEQQQELLIGWYPLVTIRKLVWGLLIHDVLGSNLGARRFLEN